MIIVNLKGGTGNQLFQYALGRHLALKNNAVLKLDVGGLDRANIVGDIYRPFQLEQFAIAAKVATPEEVKSLKYPYGIFSKAWRFISFKLSRDKNTSFHPHVLNKTGDFYLDGFWQSPRYFETIRETLLQELTLRAPLSETAANFAHQIKNTPNAVSLHVRRGDYTKNELVQKQFGSCSPTYYQEAISKIKQVVARPTFFVFSDDIPWVKANLALPEETVYVHGEGMRDTEELMLMSACAHNIIANSSFSWWGAWLNQNPDKVVVAPTPWFETAPFDKNLIPSSWTQLPK
jgi:hypothetical protein